MKIDRERRTCLFSLLGGWTSVLAERQIGREAGRQGERWEGRRIRQIDLFSSQTVSHTVYIIVVSCFLFNSRPSAICILWGER